METLGHGSTTEAEVSVISQQHQTIPTEKAKELAVIKEDKYSHQRSGNTFTRSNNSS